MTAVTIRLPELRHVAPTMVGIVGTLALWQLAATLFASLHVVPSPLAVALQLWADRGIYPLNAATTLREALLGYAIGNLAAILLASLFVELAIVERLVLKLAIASYCVPLVAIAPILVAVLPGDGPKVTLAASPSSSRRWSLPFLAFARWTASISTSSARPAAALGECFGWCAFRARYRAFSPACASRLRRRSSAR